MASVAAAHLVQFYSGSQQLAESLTSIFAVPLQRGEALVVVATQDHRAALDTALADAGVNLSAEYRSGRYLPVDVDQALGTFMTSSGPDADRFRTGIGSTIEQARRRSGTVNAYGEMVGVLAERGDLATALELEALWDRALQRHPLQLVCGYPREVVSGVSPAFDSICGVHDAVVVTRRLAEPALSATLDLPLGPNAPATARRATRDVLAAWGATDGPLADAGIVVTELVGAASRATAARVTLALGRLDGQVVVSVTDADNSRPPSVTESDLTAAGRSFAILGTVAEAWGVETLPEGTRIWARLRA
jgi:hypothetical protein